MRWLFLLALASCAPMAHGGRARVLAPGRNEVALGPELTLLGTKITPQGVTLPSFQLTLSYHRGINERLELGSRLWGFSVEQAGLQSWGGALDSKRQLRLRSNTGRGPDVAVAPSVGYHELRFGGTPEHTAFVSVPLLVGFNIGQRNQLVIGPRIAWHAWWGESQKAQRHLSYGGSIGFIWPWGQHWTFMPELVLLWAPVDFGGEASTDDITGATNLSLGLGVGLGW